MNKALTHHLLAVVVALAIPGLVGCTSTSTGRKIQPAPPALHDQKTPVALPKSSLSQRLTAQRIQDAQAARGEITVEGSVVR